MDLLGVMGAEPSLGAAVDACDGVRGEASSHGFSSICCSLRELSGEGSGDGSSTSSAQTMRRVLSSDFSGTFSRSGSLGDCADGEHCGDGRVLAQRLWPGGHRSGQRAGAATRAGDVRPQFASGEVGRGNGLATTFAGVVAPCLAAVAPPTTRALEEGA